MPASERTETQFRQTFGSLVCLPHRGDMANRWTQAHTTPAGQSLLGLPEMLTSTLRSADIGLWALLRSKAEQQKPRYCDRTRAEEASNFR